MSTASAVEVIHNTVCQQQLTSRSTGAVRFGSTGAVRFGSARAVHFGLGCHYKVPPCHCVNAMYLYVRFPGHDSVVNCSACGCVTRLVT